MSFKILKNAYKRISNTKFATSSLKETGEKASDVIYKRTKAGYGVDKTKTKERLKPLSPDYKKYRKENPPTGAFSSSTRSNLTYTGQMLNAIKVDVEKNNIIIKIDSSKRSKSNLTNSEVAARVSKERPFFKLSKAELRIVTNFVKQLIRKKKGI